MTWAGVWRLKYGLVFGVGSGRLAVQRFRLFVYSVAFGVCFGRLAVAAVSCLCLVVRVRHTATTLLN